MSSQESSGNSFWENEQQVWDDAREHFQHQALIEQTKGMLMFVYGIDADDAFEVLRRQSQAHNIKLRLVAEQILKDLVQLARTKEPDRRMEFDGLVLSAHQRISDVASRQRDGQSKTGVPMKDL
ncbi:ANTAR domain-containing protein [Mycolicibacterium hodleri]|nr:ANTAR domain-containing protein [Mycolicibacterium hodleri]